MLLAVAMACHVWLCVCVLACEYILVFNLEFLYCIAEALVVGAWSWRVGVLETWRSLKS